MRIKKLAVCMFGTTALGATMEASAVDWIMVRGTEPPHINARSFGVLSASYINNLGCEKLSGLTGGPALNNGSYVNTCRVGPELHDNDEGAKLEAAVLGSRGNLVPARINYFMTVNFGENLTTYQPLNTRRKRMASLSDASVTFSYIPGVRVRAGLFRKPGPEELMQSYYSRDYILLTDFVRRDQIERFIEGNAKGTTPIPGQGYDGSVSTYAYDADAGRDWGIQLFDAFKAGRWTHTYAVMVGNGNGIHQTDNNSEKDLNLFFASEYDLPGGKGPRKNGVKFYAYHQQGTRNFILDDTGTKSKDFERIRYGIGFKALGRLFGMTGHKHRLGAELMYAEGMVLVAATTSVTDGDFGGLIQMAAEEENKARGITLDYGFYLNKNWQFDVRYARNNLLYETVGTTTWGKSDERVIEQLTLGVNYYFSPKTRLTVNYEFRKNEAPNSPAGSNADIATRSVGDAAALRFSYFF